MNRTAKNSMMALLAAATFGFGASLAQAQTSIPLDRVYVIDQRGEVVMSGAGLCWRTGFWTPAAAPTTRLAASATRICCRRKSASRQAKAAAARAPSRRGDKITVAADALFDFDKATLRPEGKAKLDEVVAKSKAIKLEVIIAVGHTDRFGSDAYNQKLSERRAAAVKTYLVSKGIDANRVYTEGKGEKNPVTKPGQCPGPKSKKVIECLQPDRRVDIELIGTK
jgi:OOP family OmpA-OmpF porin